MSDELSAFVAKAKESLIASKLLANHQLYDFAGSRFIQWAETILLEG